MKNLFKPLIVLIITSCQHNTEHNTDGILPWSTQIIHEYTYKCNMYTIDRYDVSYIDFSKLLNYPSNKYEGFRSKWKLSKWEQYGNNCVDLININKESAKGVLYSAEVDHDFRNSASYMRLYLDIKEKKLFRITYNHLSSL